jgi:hypothetical protein
VRTESSAPSHPPPTAAAATATSNKPTIPQEKTGFEHRCDLALLSLRSDLASLRSEHLLSRIDSLKAMVFEDNENGVIVNVGVSHPEPPPLLQSKPTAAAIAAAKKLSTSSSSSTSSVHVAK